MLLPALIGILAAAMTDTVNVYDATENSLLLLLQLLPTVLFSLY